MATPNDERPDRRVREKLGRRRLPREVSFEPGGSISAGWPTCKSREDGLHAAGRRLRCLNSKTTRLPWQPSASQLRFSVIQAKDSSAMFRTLRARTIVNACQEYEETSASATAKLERKEEGLKLAHPPRSETGANLLEIHKGCLLKFSASRQEKTSHCNRNGASSNFDFGDVFADKFRGDVKPAWAMHLDTLFDDYGLATLREAMLN